MTAWERLGQKLGDRAEPLAAALLDRIERFGSGGLTLLLHWHQKRVRGVRLIEETPIEPPQGVDRKAS